MGAPVKIFVLASLLLCSGTAMADNLNCVTTALNAPVKQLSVDMLAGGFGTGVTLIESAQDVSFDWLTAKHEQSFSAHIFELNLKQANGTRVAQLKITKFKNQLCGRAGCDPILNPGQKALLIENGQTLFFNCEPEAQPNVQN